MDIKIRRLITIFFFGAFFLVAPILLLYAAGFRYDFKSGAILRTGNILVEAKDLRDADVYIDGVKHKELLTKRLFIQNLLPGEYTLKIEKSDRYPWEKKLRVEPSLTTFVIDLVLFLKSTPLQIIDKKISRFEISPTGKDLAYQTSEGDFTEIFVYNLEYGQDQLAYRAAKSQGIEMNWAPSGNKLMIHDSDIATIFRTNTSPITQIYSVALPAGQLPVWDIASDNIFYMAGGNSASQYDILEKSTKVMYEPENKTNKLLPQFLGNDQSFLILEKSGDKTKLTLVNKLVTTSTTLAELPGSENYRLISQSKDYVAVSETEQNKIYIIKKRSTSEPAELLKENLIVVDGSAANFSPDQKRLLVINDYELSYFDLDTFNLRLINRFGKKISGAEWYADNLHVIINLGDQILATDLSTGTDVPEQAVLVGDSQIVQIFLASEETIYYVTGGEKPGLYNLKIR